MGEGLGPASTECTRLSRHPMGGHTFLRERIGVEFGGWERLGERKEGWKGHL